MTFRDARAADLARIHELLTGAGLPREGVEANLRDFVVGVDSGAILAAGGLERHGEEALLRSIVIAPSARGAGIGRALCERLLIKARELGVRRLYLLTESAAPFFERLGFVRFERDAAPEAIRATEEFASLCPASATPMRRDL